MDKQVKNNETLYSISLFGYFFIGIILAFFGLLLSNVSLYIGIIIILLVGMIMHYFYVKQLKKMIHILVQKCEDIIEEKENGSVIDGEGDISILSSRLHILDIRIKSFRERFLKEQENLKIYIENISHQIKTPLTAMILKEDILLEITIGKQKKLVEEIIIQTQRIHHCIDSLLHLAQIESHSIVYQKKEYLFEDIINSIRVQLLPLLEASDVQLNVTTNQESIYCDFQWMSEALENIIKNSIEQKKHSWIDISCKAIGEYNEITIQDYGKGFIDQDIKHIFERFYRSQFQNQSKGIGIGLSISAGVIQDHHGTIYVNNHQGALFTIKLPKKNTKSKYAVTK